MIRTYPIVEYIKPSEADRNFPGFAITPQYGETLYLSAETQVLCIVRGAIKPQFIQAQFIKPGDTLLMRRPSSTSFDLSMIEYGCMFGLGKELSTKISVPSDLKYWFKHFEGKVPFFKISSRLSDYAEYSYKYVKNREQANSFVVGLMLAMNHNRIKVKDHCIFKEGTCTYETTSTEKVILLRVVLTLARLPFRVIKNFNRWHIEFSPDFKAILHNIYTKLGCNLSEHKGFDFPYEEHDSYLFIESSIIDSLSQTIEVGKNAVNCFLSYKMLSNLSWALSNGQGDQVYDNHRPVAVTGAVEVPFAFNPKPYAIAEFNAFEVKQ